MRESVNEIVREASLRLLRMHYESGVGHIGGNLSCLDLLLILHHEVLGPDDQFVLSKGHAAGALYVTLWSIGPAARTTTCSQFHKDGTRLSGHPPASRDRRTSCSPPAAWGTGSRWRPGWPWPSGSRASRGGSSA